ncbi:Ku protein [Solibaculum mannosilyticum]|uniref:Non-homologous end joining protein Ku n=1 Tax=Solibaculum mannosilyticum TaxID=2780922 RepID=A0A7I8D2F4_9FIRM|nr:Ku protein [Solibaculum mannosilyticum]BCI61010.1 non-homologous end joining protein Ku [Solibaculum mannosilyticum]
MIFVWTINKVCASCGKEVGSQDIVKGFEFEPGRYVTMTDEDFEKAKTPKDRTIQILHFADIHEICPIYYDKTYHAVPEAGGDKTYELLRKAMLEEGKVAIAKSVIGQSEKLLCLIPTEQGILVETLFFHDEVKAMPKEPAHPKLPEAELTMAKALVKGMSQAFDPTLYHDQYQVRLREIIEAKINGKEITEAPGQQPSNVINIMDALEASLKQMGDKGKTPSKRGPGRKKTAKAGNAS